MKKFGNVLLGILIVILISIVGFGGWYLVNALNKSNQKIEDLESKIVNNVENKQDNKDDGNPDDYDKTKKDSDDENNKKTQKLTEEEMYKSIISDYKNALNEYDEEDFESIEKIANKYDMISLTVIEHMVHYQSTGLKILYTFYDIDKNGIKELIVGVGNSKDNAFYEGAIYTYNQNTNKPEKIYYQETMERGRLYVYDNGIIFSEGAGGAALHYYTFGKISDNGNSFNLIEEIEEEYSYDDSIPVYKNYKTNKVLDYKNLDEIQDKYLSNSEVVKYSNYFEI